MESHNQTKPVVGRPQLCVVQIFYNFSRFLDRGHTAQCADRWMTVTTIAVMPLDVVHVTLTVHHPAHRAALVKLHKALSTLFFSRFTECYKPCIRHGGSDIGYQPYLVNLSDHWARLFGVYAYDSIAYVSTPETHEHLAECVPLPIQLHACMHACMHALSV